MAASLGRLLRAGVRVKLQLVARRRWGRGEGAPRAAGVTASGMRAVAGHACKESVPPGITHRFKLLEDKDKTNIPVETLKQPHVSVRQNTMRDRPIEDLLKNGGCVQFMPAVTQHAPFFKGTAVVNGEFKDLNLDDFKGKYLVLFFYPLDFTFVCPTELVAFSDKASEFRDINCEVVAVSVDSHFSHLAWINTPRKNGGLGTMHISLLSDLTKQISRDYGVLLEGAGVALRGLFIVDPNGIVKHLSVNDLSVGRSVEETLRLVRAFQYVETHGEVCPANWTPNSPTIKPSPQGSKEYFEKVH